MSVPLAPDRLAQLLPALDMLAEALTHQDPIDPSDRRVILLGLGLDDDWAVQEVERWATILASARTPGRVGLAQRALVLRGVPEAEATRAVQQVAGAASAIPPAMAAPVVTRPTTPRGWFWGLLTLWVVVVAIVGMWLWQQMAPEPPAVAVVAPTAPPLTATPLPMTSTLPAATATAQPPTPTLRNDALLPLTPLTLMPTPTTVSSATLAASPSRPAATATALPPTLTPLPLPSATRQLTPTPIPPTRTPIPRATLRPAAAACAPPAGPTFIEVWGNLGLDEQTGCPITAERRLITAYTPFERGFMVWRQDTKQIYAIYNDGTWQEFGDTWNEGDPEYSCPNADTPSRTPPTPGRGIGKAWCTQPGVRERLGQALRAESGNARPIQDFQRGVMLAIIERDVPVYTLLTETRRWVGGE